MKWYNRLWVYPLIIILMIPGGLCIKKYNYWLDKKLYDWSYLK